MEQHWKALGIKEQIQYTTAIILVISGIIIAFLSFFLNAFNIEDGVLIYIAQAFIMAGGIFGISLYFKSKIGEFESKAMNNIINKIEQTIDDKVKNKENS